jgi:hypothetical protein
MDELARTRDDGAREQNVLSIPTLQLPEPERYPIQRLLRRLSAKLG